jgi:REP element-mobilizing transposase RayT
MARKHRIQGPGLLHHVMSRGNARMAIFLDPVDYREFVHLLGEVVEEFEIRCWNYCAMPNHYHATLQPTRANLSEAMQKLNGDYGRWWNRRYARVGHVFQGRYKHQIVQRETYLLELTRYVVLNPVRASLVDHPEDWPWSSYRATAGLLVAPPFLAESATLSLFGDGDLPTLRARFIDHVRASRVDEGLQERIRSSERTLGDREFKLMVGRTTRAEEAPSPDRPAHRDVSSMSRA